jgi:hypothetical protein
MLNITQAEEGMKQLYQNGNWKMMNREGYLKNNIKWNTQVLSNMKQKE